MKTSTQNRVAKSVLTLGAAALFLSGCLTKNEDPTYASDGQAAYLTSELDQMGQIYASTEAAKTSATEKTISGELIITPYAYKDSCKCFVRKATLTTSEGYERLRIDSVTLFDSAGAILSKFQPSLIGRIVHSRNVTKTKGDKEANIRFDITVEIKSEAGLKVGVWNGTMTGSYNDQVFKSGTISNLTRVWENGRFHFPKAGTIELDRPAFHYQAEFLGEGKAMFKVKNKLNKKMHMLYVDKDYKETEAVEAL